MQYFEHAASETSLRRGLDQAVRNRAGCGPDGVTVAEFARRADAELARLRTELLTGGYRPRPARQMRIPKPGGGYRSIAVSCVRDRVVQHAFAITLGQELDGVLHDRAYAYRKGRSTHDALTAVERSLRDGLGWTLRADVESFFDTIPHALLLGELERTTRCASVRCACWWRPRRVRARRLRAFVRRSLSKRDGCSRCFGGSGSTPS